jgi:hypothetical protein
MLSILLVRTEFKGHANGHVNNVVCNITFRIFFYSMYIFYIIREIHQASITSPPRGFSALQGEHQENALSSQKFAISSE